MYNYLNEFKLMWRRVLTGAALDGTRRDDLVRHSLDIRYNIDITCMLSVKPGRGRCNHS